MKVIRWIQNVVAAVALVTAIGMVDKLEVPFKDAFAAGLLVILAMVMLLGRALEEERRAE
ncbi:hypothetical protein [Bacteroides sp.]|uniref:hypothetical protein n=1 Tax=Bacteroides sp. TaxID=29523 RepID=UPI002612E5C7|nr:hypothetical protein [Bacteroides sp.]MDD3040927.1 hypothetical protein [Bacteroides sp.]